MYIQLIGRMLALPQGAALFPLTDILILNQTELATYAKLDHEPVRLEDVSLAARKLMSRPEAEAWARQLFKALDLPDPENFGARYPHQASGGQLQRAMAAMAMSCRPDVLVLDAGIPEADAPTLLRELFTGEAPFVAYATVGVLTAVSAVSASSATG